MGGMSTSTFGSTATSDRSNLGGEKDVGSLTMMNHPGGGGVQHLTGAMAMGAMTANSIQSP